MDKNEYTEKELYWAFGIGIIAGFGLSIALISLLTKLLCFA